MNVLVRSLFFCLIFSSAAYGLMFELQPNGRKCLREEVQKDVLVTGDYEISEVPGQRTDIKVCCVYKLKKSLLNLFNN